MITTTVRVMMTIAALFGGLSVAAGAFAAHALKARWSTSALASFETAARYQMYHALALLLVVLLLSRAESAAETPLKAAGIAFIVGTVLFSGSLYTLSATGIKWLGAIAPLGGLAFIIGWGCLAVAAWSWQ